MIQHTLLHVVYIEIKRKFPYLAPAIEFVGQFDLAEGHGLLHPVCPEVWRVGVDVDTVGCGWFSLAPCHPVTIDVFPAVSVYLDEVQQQRVHGVRVKATYADLENRKHPPRNMDRLF